MPIEVRIESVIPAPFDAVWERSRSVEGANNELWPLARVTFSVPLGGQTRPEEVIGVDIRSWTLALGFLPMDRRTVRFDVFEEGRFHECSDSWLQGHACHERTVVAIDRASSCVTDILIVDARGRFIDAIVRQSITATFKRRHRRMKKYFAA